MMPQVPVTSAYEEDAAAVFELFVAPELPCLRGHFPQQAMLPGVVQVQWAVQLARQHWPALAEFQSLSKLKFQRPILPGTHLRLRLNLDQDELLRFQFSGGEQEYSSGRIRFAAR